MTIGVDDDESAFSGLENDRELEKSWLRICARLKDEVGEVEYRTWLTKIALGPIDGDEITLLLPTRFLRDWVRSQYGDRLSELWHQENQALRRVELQVARPGDPAPVPLREDGPARAAATPFQDDTPPPRPAPSIPDSRSDLVTALDTRFTFDTFVVGKPNEFAYACARRVAEKPSSAGFNPLFLYGGVGLGKTHLMHAIGAELIKTGQVSVAYMSAEKFMYRFIAAIRSQSTIEFKEQQRSVDAMMIDVHQFLTGYDNTQEPRNRARPG